MPLSAKIASAGARSPASAATLPAFIAVAAAASASGQVAGRFGPGDSPVKELALVGAAPWGVFDPLNIANEDEMDYLLWYRAAELKHGRVCMLAFTGWWVTVAFNFHLKGFISVEEKVSFDDIANVDWFADSWAKVPASGQAQILTVIGLLEWYTECNGVHYTKGGAMPNYPPFNNAKQLMALEMKPEKLVAQQTKELNNGRLAMIGVASLFAQHYIPGSVPLLKGII